MNAAQHKYLWKGYVSVVFVCWYMLYISDHVSKVAIEVLILSFTDSL